MRKKNGISLNLKKWESEFFNKKLYQLTINESFVESDLFQSILDQLSEIKFDIIEINLNVKNIKVAEILEKIGFKLVDSRITFLTKIDLNETKFDFPIIDKSHKIRFYNPSDLSSLIQITEKYLTYNEDFISRYKNLHYFNIGDSEKYFKKWITYSVTNSASLTAVVEHKGKVIGFFIFQRKEDIEKLPLYKGILVAVKHQYQGFKLHLSLQSFLFKSFNSKQFYIDNTTQLSNYGVIKNHIRSNRKLNKMELTFMFSKNDFLCYKLHNNNSAGRTII